MYRCECTLEFKNNGALKMHKKYCNLKEEDVKLIRKYYLEDYLSISDILEKYKNIVGKAIIYKILNGIMRNSSESMKNAHKNKPEKFKHTEETKKKLREIRLEWMKENPEKTAWRQANLSYPEKIFRNKIEDLGMDKKYLIIREYSVFPYFIDFAFVDEKIAIEIDGSQHELPERIESDMKKDKLLNEMNWRVIRIPAKDVLTDIDAVFINLSKVFKNGIEYEDTGIIKYSKHIREFKTNYCECGVTINKKAKKCKKCNDITQRIVVRPPYEVLLKEVNETNYCAVGRKYGVSDNTIRKWIKQYEKIK